MKKLIALLVVCGFALAFVACGEKKEAAQEEAPMEEVAPAPAVEEVPADTMAMEADTTAAQ